MSDKVIRSCVDCVTQSCVSEDGRNPAFCPSRDFRLEGATALLAELDKPDVFDMVKKSAQAASRAFAAQMSRIEEIMNFARECGFTRLGIASCRNVVSEARAAACIFRDNGFEVYGALCKIGSLTRPDLGIDEGNPTSKLCNPIYQAQLLNEQGVDFNIIIGLCVGHDSLFMKYADAPCTTLLVKDYKFDNNPACALRVEQRRLA